MRTRDVLRWNATPWTYLYLASICMAGFAIGVLDRVVIELERYVNTEKGDDRCAP